MKYFGGWNNLKDLISDFEEVNNKNFPKDEEIILASYDLDGYEGLATVIFQKSGKIYEVHGYHCSCYGFEGQWDPEETTIEALLQTKFFNCPEQKLLKKLLEDYK